MGSWDSDPQMFCNIVENIVNSLWSSWFALMTYRAPCQQKVFRLWTLNYSICLFYPGCFSGVCVWPKLFRNHLYTTSIYVWTWKWPSRPKLTSVTFNRFKSLSASKTLFGTLLPLLPPPPQPCLCFIIYLLRQLNKSTSSSASEKSLLLLGGEGVVECETRQCFFETNTLTVVRFHQCLTQK